MKQLRTQFWIAVLSLTVLSSASGQGTFRNLDFENPIPPLLPNAGFTVPITNALPGWSAYIGDTSIDRVVYNTVSLGAAAVSLHDHGSSLQPVEGNYSVMLQPSIPSLQTSAAVGQIGQVPSTAKSLVFYGTPSMQVTFAGQPISLVTLGATSEYFIRGGDVSQFAGQTGELRFTEPVAPLGSVMAGLDNIQFSPEPIPEPSVVGLFVLGTLLIGWRWRRKPG